MFGILVFGDSIAVGRGESPNIGWAGRLKKYFEPQGFYNCLFNLGIPGDTSRTLLERFETEIKSRVRYAYTGDKFIIMIAVGINDTRGLGSPDRPETKPAKFRNNMEKLFRIAKKYTKYVVVIGLTPVDETRTDPYEDTYFRNEIVLQYDRILRQTAGANRAYHIPLFDAIREDCKSLLADGVHPNKRGYKEMHVIIKDFLIDKGLIS